MILPPERIVLLLRWATLEGVTSAVAFPSETLRRIIERGAVIVEAGGGRRGVRGRLGGFLFLTRIQAVLRG
jgi:hypothetical protein